MDDCSQLPCMPNRLCQSHHHGQAQATLLVGQVPMQYSGNVGIDMKTLYMSGGGSQASCLLTASGISVNPRNYYAMHVPSLNTLMADHCKPASTAGSVAVRLNEAWAPEIGSPQGSFTNNTIGYIFNHCRSDLPDTHLRIIACVKNTFACSSNAALSCFNLHIQCLSARLPDNMCI